MYLYKTSIYYRSIACLLISLLILSSCVQQAILDTVIENNKRLHFSGKGAGAGIMLSSAMGPVGMAIGFAIDEGIAKDIRHTANQHSIRIEDILRKELESVLLPSQLKKLNHYVLVILALPHG